MGVPGHSPRALLSAAAPQLSAASPPPQPGPWRLSWLPVPAGVALPLRKQLNLLGPSNPPPGPQSPGRVPARIPGLRGTGVCGCPRLSPHLPVRGIAHRIVSLPLPGSVSPAPWVRFCFSAATHPSLLGSGSPFIRSTSLPPPSSLPACRCAPPFPSLCGLRAEIAFLPNRNLRSLSASFIFIFNSRSGVFGHKDAGNYTLVRKVSVCSFMPSTCHLPV